MEEYSILKDWVAPRRDIFGRLLSRRPSGSAMRRHLFFLTPPMLYDYESDYSLYVSRTKEGMIQALQSEVTAVVPRQPQQDIPMLEYTRYPGFQDYPKVHKIRVQIRLPANRGGVGDGCVLEFDDMINDTGTTTGMIFTSDWARLNVNNRPTRLADVTFSDGSFRNMPLVTYETRLVQRSDQGIFAVSDWMEDQSTVVDDPVPGVETKRLCGFGMRQRLYFLTPPTDTDGGLYIARSKKAMIQLLQSLQI